MIEIDKTILDCDVLVVGGGIAGLNGRYCCR